MQLKTYKAHDLATALDRARRELGPKAIVLATNEIQGRLGLSHVEITVAVDPARVSTAKDLQRLAQEVGSIRRRAETEVKPVQKPASAPAPVPTGTETSPDPSFRTAVEALVRSGLSSDLALRFARIASDHLRTRDERDLVAATDLAMEELVPFTSSPVGTHVLFVVGPPGAGKTTTIAKLAALTAHRQSRRVVYAQADSSRLDSLQQAQIYARNANIDLTSVRTPDDLSRAIRSVGRDGSVLVDTAGIGAADTERLLELISLRRSSPAAQVVLLIPSGLHHDEARDVVDRFDPVRPTCIAFSRVDDGRRLGELVTATAASRLPLAFITNGHRIPEDIEDASPRGLAALLLRSGFRASSTQESRS